MESKQEISFLSFPEIENHYNKETIKFIEEHGDDQDWVATEKVHGTNFCFICDGVEVTCAKRTSLLAEKDGFMNFQTIAKKYNAMVMELFNEVKAIQADVKLIRVFGEFYGGYYNHPDVAKPKSKPIQTGPSYCDGLDFEAFDLFFENGESTETP
jgi:Rnl2 family RNA ligase